MRLVLAPLHEVGVATLPPDLVWLKLDGTPARAGELGTHADFAVATSTADGGAGGLVARNPILTATIAHLFTDARPPRERVPAGFFGPGGDGDLRGWVGDGFDVDLANGEGPLGSYLWLYRRSVLSAGVAMEVEVEALRALRPLVAQGVVARTTATATYDEERDLLALAVNHYRRDGSSLLDARFDPLWRRVDGGL